MMKKKQKKKNPKVSLSGYRLINTHKRIYICFYQAELSIFTVLFYMFFFLLLYVINYNFTLK